MLRSLKLALFLVVTIVGSMLNASAATVGFTGIVNADNGVPPTFLNSAVALQLDYTPTVGLTGVVNAATLVIGGDSWSTLVGPASIQIIEDAVGVTENLLINLGFGPSTNGLGGTVSNLSLTFAGGLDLGAAPDLNETNVALLTAGNVGQGSLFLFSPVRNINFSATAAVPEPSSVFAMGAIGLCLAGGAWRKRKQAQVTAE